jgi:SepF-like predicted cell division protein (DUF552 family)
MVLDKLKKLAGRKTEEAPAEEGEEFLEIPESSMRDNAKVGVKIMGLKAYEDIDKVQNVLRDGTVVFLRIGDLRHKDIAELKRAVDRLKKTCTAMGGDMVGVDEDFLIITPSFAQVYRGKM